MTKGSIFYAKGLAIILVAIGHYYPASSPEYWRIIREAIYTFHMPVFFLVSGYLFGLSRGSRPYMGLLHLARLKFFRLGLPFISIAVIFFIIKYVSGLFFELEYPLTFATALNIFIDPVKSYKPLLWFLYSLFSMFMIHAMLSRLLPDKRLLFALIVLLSLINFPDLFCLRPTFANFPFFVSGILMGGIDLDRSPRRIWILIGAAVIVFIVAFWSYRSLEGGYQVRQMFRLILGLSGTAFVILAAGWMNKKDWGLFKPVFQAGVYSQSIYLFHTLFASTVRVAYYQILSLSGDYFLIGAFVAVAVGILGPLVMEKYLLRKYDLTRKLILGFGPLTK